MPGRVATTVGLVLASGLLFASPRALAETPLPSCRYDDLPTPHPGYDAWSRTLLDTIYALPASYAPDDLVSTREAGLDQDYLVRALLIDDLQALLRAAEAAGAPLEIQSAYRSFDYQERVFGSWVERDGVEAALRSSARPGHSEHQLGTTLDFRSAGGRAPWELADWADTPAGAWLAANGWRYGFVMSYPKGLEDETCYIYEPWHYRYLGRERAGDLRRSGLTLRRYLWSQQEP